MVLFIQKLLPYLFGALIALPLPILILYYPIHSVYEKLMQRRYYKIVKKHLDNPATASAEQLQQIFPGKKPKEIEGIAYHLQEESTYKD